MESLKDILKVFWAASFAFIVVLAIFCICFYFLGDEDDAIKLKEAKKLLIIVISFNLFLTYILQKNL